VLRSAFTQAEKWLLVPRNVVKLTYSHLLPDLMRKERAAAKLDAILGGGNASLGQNPGQTDRLGVDDQEKSSNSFEDVVSRVGIVPERRGRRPKPERLRITRRHRLERSERR
jgi:hypothetical protein